MMAISSLSRLATLFSWRNAAILFALANLKNLPFAWHLRLFYHFARNMRRPEHVRSVLNQGRGRVHALFQPVSIFSRSPFLEIDYNLHKSNSTYFSDLDVSRTALVTNLLSAGLRTGSEELEEQGHRGKYNVILGSVHTSYHKEIKPYTKYEVRSRVLGWDQKWIVILSLFIRPASGDKEEQVFASSLSKYVVKKGRYTVPPETCLRSAGWIPERPAENPSPANEATESGILVRRPDEQEQKVDIERLERKAQEMSSLTDDGLAPTISPGGADRLTKVTFLAEQAGQDSDAENPTYRSVVPPELQIWDWARIEQERLRGLEIVRKWLSLDAELQAEAVRIP